MRHGSLAVISRCTNCSAGSFRFPLVVLGANLFLLNRPFFRATLALQIGFYIIAFAGLFFAGGRAPPLVGSDVLLHGERCGVDRYSEMSRGPEFRPMDAATKTIRRNAQRAAGEPPCRLRKIAARSS